MEHLTNNVQMSMFQYTQTGDVMRQFRIFLFGISVAVFSASLTNGASNPFWLNVCIGAVMMFGAGGFDTRK